MKLLASMSLIPTFASIKSFKYQMCVQSKQTHKPHKAAEARNLAPLELVHSDLCEMNGVLTKGEKRYFMMLVDDSTRFCYVYLLKSKDKAFHHLKSIKLKKKTNLRERLSGLGSIMVESIFLMSSIYSARNTV